MCEPTTLAWIAIGASALGTGVSAMGQYQQGKQAQAVANYNAQVAENNAKSAQYAADDAIRRGQIAEDAHRSRVRQTLGTQRALAGAGGDLTDQSTAAILADTAGYGELDALTIRANAAREAWGFQNQVTNSLAEAAGTRMQGEQAASSGRWGAAGTILSGTANGFTQYRANKLRIG